MPRYQLSDGDPLPHEEDVLRYCSPSRMNKSPEGTPIFPKPGAFTDARGSLSVNWMGFFCGSEEEVVQRIRVSCGLSLKKNGRFAKLKVEDVREIIKAETENCAYVTYTPRKDNPSHSSIVPASFEIGIALANLVHKKIHEDTGARILFDAVP